MVAASQRSELERAVHEVIDRALRHDDSVFTPGRYIWTLDVIERLGEHLRFVGENSLQFSRKLYEQLEIASPEVVQLAGELHYVYFLLQDIDGRNKRKVINEVLWPLITRDSHSKIRIPPHLDVALDSGIGDSRFTPDHHAHRSAQLRYLLEFVRRWKTLDEDERTHALGDRDTFRSLLHGIPTHDDERHAGQQRRAIMYLVHDLGSNLPWTEKSGEQDADGNEEETDSLATLADRLLLDVSYLQRVEQLLEAKGQLIFYGPPGTGKTYVARELAKFYAGDEGSVELVQFHPSYAYEDFIEGYRPDLINGQPGFRLADGPLKRIAQAAIDRPDARHMLVIDELNRGNVAKVLGELYFLLEYRDEEINLQYSAEPFKLPENLWIIGTMNTADRSIALIDAALRRRFYFVPFMPDEPPVQGLLRRWLERENPRFEWVADVVDRANLLLGDRHMAIGPSYFMTSLSEEWVELIWEHSVMPYIAEQFFGEEDSLDQFRLNALRGITDPVEVETTDAIS